MRIGEATNQKDLLAALETTRNHRLDLRRPFEVVWWNNLALIAGDHYSRYDPNMSRFEDRDMQWDTTLTDKKPRMVVNHALTVARTELSKLTKSKPVMEVLANSDDPADIAATKVGKAMLDYCEWKFKLRRMRKQALWWMIATGICAEYVGWDYQDNRAGYFKFVIDPDTNEPTFNPDREKELKDMVDAGELEPDELKEESYPLGEMCFKLFTPLQLLPDETATDFDQIRDLITTEVVDVDVLRGMYGDKAKNVKPENVVPGVIEQRMLQRFGSARPNMAPSENGVAVHTWWLIPNTYTGNNFLKDGMMVRWCQSNIQLEMSEGGFPYADGRMPFAFYQHIPNNTTIWPDSVITHIRDANLEIDKTISQLVENKDYTANPMWRIATQHKIKGQVKNVAGGIIRYVHVPNIPPPEPVPGLQMPNQVENLLVGLRNQILDISGQSEVARGRVPTGVRSGVAVAYLQEEDDTKIAPTVENMEEAIAYSASLCLSRAGQYYATQRLLRYYKPDGIFDVIKFKGADLRDNTDVVPQAGSAMPKSKAARQQYTLELVSLGILTDPHKIQEMLELGQGEPDDTDKMTKQADRENNIMLHGMTMGMFKRPEQAESPEQLDQWAQQTVVAAVPVKKWHNHQLHIQRHTSQMMEEEFDHLQVTHPEIPRLFDEHIAMHEQFIQAQMQQQIAMMQAAKGSSADLSGGGQPGAGDEGSGNGAAGQTQLMGQTFVPDVVGGGAQQLRARTTRPGPHP